MKKERKFHKAVTHETITTTISAGRDERSKGNALSDERDDDALSKSLFFCFLFFFEKRERMENLNSLSLSVVSPRGTFRWCWCCYESKRG